MSEAYGVPGVVVEESHALAMSIQSGETAVPVLIGHFNAVKPTHTIECVPVESWLAFTQQFGAADVVEVNEEVFHATSGASGLKHTAHVGSYSVRSYFENGGGPCYVLPLPDQEAQTLTAMVAAIERCPDITLLVWCEHTDKDAEVYAKLGTLLGAGASSGGNRGMFLLADAQAKDAQYADFVVPGVADLTQVATYFPALVSQYAWEPPDQYVSVTNLPDEYWGGSVPIEIKQTESLTLERLKDLRLGALKRGDDDAKVLARKYLALYQGFRQLVVDALAARPMIVRASAAMAGVMARVDRERGVWKAPANVGLVGVQGLVANVAGADHAQESWQAIRPDDTLNGRLVEHGINAIRWFRGQGAMVWGARTAATGSDTRWHYVPVRRLFNTVERDARAALRTAVFEPNSAPTWEAVRGALDHYLHALWRQGALQGDTPAQAY
ncbi:phage tail sheath C-terminal domain-containing protein, partial [Burkholderia stagnalis]